eukprot:TRINITY_DN15126_c0_g2_i2.p1 TRINITY_DN15126_c0_g2~~TRINITY_DN15126_c0_g2_i2.p1  ORF type:complete len:451 (+),score=65.67 TRINITY_DN15126_c0_g2_i2:76-1428(+)
MLAHTAALVCGFAACGPFLASASAGHDEILPKARIFFSHDGGVDDFIALQLLATNELRSLVGIAVTPADCFLEPAVVATAKVLDVVSDLGQRENASGNIPIFNISGARAAVSSFPDAWRRASLALAWQPSLHMPSVLEDGTRGKPLRSSLGRWQLSSSITSTGDAAVGSQALRHIAKEVHEHLCGPGSGPHPARGEATWVEVGPLTLLAEIAHLLPENLFGPPGSGACITRVFWMGGALDVPGNVSPFLVTPVSGRAEWNAFWDAPAASVALSAAAAARAEIRVVPLDATNDLPVTGDFIKKLSEAAAVFKRKAMAQKVLIAKLESEEHFNSTLWAQAHSRWHAYGRCHSLSELAAGTYALAYRGFDGSYFMWDVLTAAAVLRPDLVKFQERQIQVVTTGPDVGATQDCGRETTDTSCIAVRIASIDPSQRERIYSFVKDQLTGGCMDLD